MSLHVFFCRSFQNGMTLLATLLVLLVVLMLGIAGSQIAVQSEKSSRNDRDHQIAFQAAEAALLDAEMDIEHAPDGGRSRSDLFSNTSAIGFPAAAGSPCGSGENNPYLGLCHHSEIGAAPIWQVVNFMDDAATTSSSVPYGRFTGQSFHTANGSLPSKLPRYIVELMPYKMSGGLVDAPSYFYRITAVGFGAKETTQVALQTVYRKTH
ncbi:pilus assembly PilX family protein [Herminiimonas fonticola]|uniref:Type IV pilus assembly protein PilX n=1 Tax=Herminiimonas fonticola TaxID=303380 RepID=A0A4R6G630_9BURK|nr:PilX N-terminal domain-containing pilus assembly protein [Herminiimonas fonticola]RBA23936.1 Tfp pilus assembly protein PilX [Herminiimonas fonticola]TDN89936.1 type IV pilus assembly protein PilX [Herminiimonas fonticola]